MEKEPLHNEINKELESISPLLLKHLPKKNKEDIPFRYFENLPDRVFDEINSTPKTISIVDKLKSWFITHRLQPILVPVVLMGVVGLVALFMYKNKERPVLDLASLTMREVNEYLYKNASELEDDQLYILSQSAKNEHFIELEDEELQPVLDEYLYQIQYEDLN